MLTTLALIALLLVATGGYRLHCAYRAFRIAQAWATYRAASMIVTERAKLRAAQHRASEREWGRAA